MSSAGEGLSYRRLRVPRHHGEALIDPPLDCASVMVQQNQAQRVKWDFDCQGLSFNRLASDARADLIQQACDFTLAYRDSELPKGLDSDWPILLAGHQPELFHAGVWFKNFTLSALGKGQQFLPISLLIDNDVVRSAAIRVPSCSLGGSVADPYPKNIQFDGPTQDCPYEDRTINDGSLFDSFGERVRQAISPLVAEPLIDQLWPLAIEAKEQSDNLGLCIAQARHRLEGQWGLETLEVPLSQICETEPFYWFMTYLFAQLPQFHGIYNGALAEYRRVNHLRSRSHPVPDLATVDQWLESPFWVWSSGDFSRRRLFVRCRGDEIELSDLDAWSLSLPLSADRDAAKAVESLAELSTQGVKIRPRALMTTMYSRLFLSDLFLHGIGGAKYDQLTDLIISRFFGFQPPSFITLSATTKLPIQHSRMSDTDLLQVNHHLRDMIYNPQRHLDLGNPRSSVSKIISEKQRWIETLLPRGERGQRHREITRINKELQKHVTAKRKTLLRQREALALSSRREALLDSREFSFCLFPEETLRPLLLELSSSRP